MTVFFVKSEARFSSRAEEREQVGSLEGGWGGSAVRSWGGIRSRQVPRHLVTLKTEPLPEWRLVALLVLFFPSQRSPTQESECPW